ncbi:hypothetical protein MMB17_19285 [Methylobacterium organophilum]|uniref:hypothetical protein n=1 Tax=Methylobacterium organophilum TaxID=410 RepID=UPI001F143FF5|nr:hypothetical protein [Methylobacterium organophilum]UMY16790.1 hypothetical protein MMB17_19285 [Methylobacterium organophilum]
MPADKVLEHLWRYFALHAQQRVSVFNFFVVLSGVISAAIGGALQVGGPLNFVVVILGLLLPLLSFVFWRLDQRNSDLVKIAERALRRAEEAHLPDYARIFVRESLAGTGAAAAEDRLTQTRWTFRMSFRLIFVVMGIAGTLASGFAVYRWISYPAAKGGEAQRAGTLPGADSGPAVPPASRAGSSQGPGPERPQEPGQPGSPSTEPRSAPRTEPTSRKGEAPKH